MSNVVLSGISFSTIFRLLKFIDLWGSKYTARTDRGQQRAPNYWSEITTCAPFLLLYTQARTHTHTFLLDDEKEKTDVQWEDLQTTSDDLFFKCQD